MLRQPEIENLHPPVAAYKGIGRLDIAMDRSSRVRRREAALAIYIVVSYWCPQSLQPVHLGLPIGVMGAVGGRMGHLVDQEFRHGPTENMVSEKSEEDLATREVNKSSRLASRRVEPRISGSSRFSTIRTTRQNFNAPVFCDLPKYWSVIRLELRPGL